MQDSVKNKVNIRIIIFIVVSLVIVVYTLLMISGYSGASESDRTTGNKDGQGYYIFSTLLKRLGYNIQTWEQEPEFSEDAVLFYFHYKPNRKKEFESIKQWVARGNILFLLGMDGDSDPFFNNTLIMSDRESLTLAPALTPGVETFNFQTSLYFDSESRGERIIGNSRGALLIKNTYETGTVYLLSDPGFLSNINLADENNAIVLNNLLKEYYGYSLFIHEPVSVGAAHPILPLFRGKLFYMTIHFLLMGIVFALCYGIRFGNPIASHPFIRRTLQAHLNAVGVFYQKTHALNLTDTYDSKYFVYKVKEFLGLKKKVSCEELSFLLKKGYALEFTGHEITLLLKETGNMSERNLLRKRIQRIEFIKTLRKLKKGVR